MERSVKDRQGCPQWHSCHPSAEKVEAGGPRVQGHPGCYRRPCLNRTKSGEEEGEGRERPDREKQSEVLEDASSVSQISLHFPRCPSLFLPSLSPWGLGRARVRVTEWHSRATRAWTGCGAQPEQGCACGLCAGSSRWSRRDIPEIFHVQADTSFVSF